MRNRKGIIIKEKKRKLNNRKRKKMIEERTREIGVANRKSIFVCVRLFCPLIFLSSLDLGLVVTS